MLLGNKFTILINFLLMILTNALANILPINNITTGAVSNSYPNLFAPSPVTFSIWGLIYSLLLLHTLYQLGLFRNKDKKGNVDLLKQIGSLFSLTSIINTVWIFAWHYKQIGLTVVLMVCLLTGLILIANKIRLRKLSFKEVILVKIPFSVYFGWITVATIANVTTFLVSINWNGFGISDSVWTIIILAVGAFIGIVRSIYDKSLAYILVFIWAYYGIYLKHTQASNFNGMYPGIKITLILLIVLFLGTSLYLVLTPGRIKALKR